jgi:hypothetical protein
MSQAVATLSHSPAIRQAARALLCRTIELLDEETLPHLARFGAEDDAYAAGVDAAIRHIPRICNPERLPQRVLSWSRGYSSVKGDL